MINSQDTFLRELNANIQNECHTILSHFDLENYEKLLAGGRRLRSVFAYTASKSPNDKLIKACTALELLHTSTLELSPFTLYNYSL